MCNFNVKDDILEHDKQVIKKETTTLTSEQMKRLLKLPKESDDSKHNVSHVQRSNNNVFTVNTQQGKL